MKCQACGREVPAEGNFCDDCGAPIAPAEPVQGRGKPSEAKKFCRNCGRALSLEARFCGGCGANVPQPEESAEGSSQETQSSEPMPPEQSSPPVCRRCGKVLSAAARFCGGCGARRDAPQPENAAEEPAHHEKPAETMPPDQESGPCCKQCGKLLSPAAKFCGGCGTPVAESRLPAEPQGTDAGTSDEDAADGPRPPRFWTGVRPRRLLAAAGLAVLLIGAGLALHALWSYHIVTVPDVVGLAQSRAQATLSDGHLTGRIVRTVLHDAAAVGVVVSQDPAAGRRTRRGRTVALVVSAGRAVAVPPVVGKSSSAALADLNAAKLVGKVSGSRGDAAAPDTVLASDPAPGKPAAEGSEVHLTVSTGSSSQNATKVVAVEGLDQEVARQTLANAGLTMEVADKIFSESPHGQVIYQNPQPGKDPLPGKVVRVQVSLGRGIPVPPLREKSLAQAERVLSQMGLHKRVDYEFAPASKDTVLRSSPGKVAADGDRVVHLVVSKGPRLSPPPAGPPKASVGDLVITVTGVPRGHQISYYVDPSRHQAGTECPATRKDSARHEVIVKALRPGTHELLLFDAANRKSWRSPTITIHAGINYIKAGWSEFKDD